MIVLFGFCKLGQEDYGQEQRFFVLGFRYAIVCIAALVSVVANATVLNMFLCMYIDGTSSLV